MARSGEAILVVDSGTTSTRSIVFAPDGEMLATSRKDLTQYYPRPGWVEHDADQIRRLTLATMREAVEAAGGVGRIAAVGLTNQRETVVAWDRNTGRPLHRALVWQDRRTAAACEALRQAGHEPSVQERTGLLLDPYFSATKMRWLLDNVPEVRAASDAGTLALGTIDAWLMAAMTGAGPVSDAGNASRTSLLALDGASWDEGLCDLFGVAASALPRVVDNLGELGTLAPDILGEAVPITGIAGDQQAATIGQGCLTPGQTKGTYGTGAFILTNMGENVPRSQNRLLATVLCQQDGRRSYALEGSIFVAGSLVKWLRDSLGLIATAQETEALARSVPDNAGVVIVPALSGLGAPHWLPDARGLVSGLSFAAGRAHIARAALEAMAMQTHDLALAFAGDGARWTGLRIDGGMSANDWMAQDLADILALPVERPDNIETTALGAAMLAATGAGLYASLTDAADAMRGRLQDFSPEMPSPARQARLDEWQAALDAL